MLRVESLVSKDDMTSANSIAQERVAGTNEHLQLIHNQSTI